jgi:ribosome-associated toxin RatA of RatAB toxin-antitoxin module
MKELQGAATTRVSASVAETLELLSAVQRYPSWYPDVVRRVEVLERRSDGTAARARTTLHVSQGPFTRDIDLVLSVETQPAGTVQLTRIPHDGRDRELFSVTWRVAEAQRGTKIDLELEANLSVPRLVPLGGVGGAVARGFVDAAARALDGGAAR